MENEIKLDGRVSPECLYEKRKQVVALHRKGMRLNAICETVGLCWKAVRKAIDLYESGGVRALRPKKWGRPTGTSRTLTAEQEKQVRKDICDKRPGQMKMDFALWTREAMLVYIREHFGMDMPVRTVGEYLKRWGFTPQNPIKVASGESQNLLQGQAHRLCRRINLIYCRHNNPKWLPESFGTATSLFNRPIAE